MAKSPDAFRTISEVAEWLDTPAHVLRFWESKFTQVKPVKRAGGRRYYRPADMELLGGIKKLLHDDGMTIKGVQKMLSDKGVKAVAALSPAVDGPDIEAVTARPDPEEARAREVDTPTERGEAERSATEETTPAAAGEGTAVEEAGALADKSVRTAPEPMREAGEAAGDGASDASGAAEPALDPGALPEPPADPRPELDVAATARDHADAPAPDIDTDETSGEETGADRPPLPVTGLDVGTGTDTSPEAADSGDDGARASDGLPSAESDEAATGFAVAPEAPAVGEPGAEALDTSQGDLFPVAAGHVPSFLSTPLSERPGAGDEAGSADDTPPPAPPAEHTEVDTGIAAADLTGPAEPFETEAGHAAESGTGRPAAIPGDTAETPHDPVDAREEAASPAIAAAPDRPQPEDLPPPPGPLFHVARINRLTAAQAARIAPLVERLSAFRDR
ncbi:MerR family transcriptional regulator [Roseivivax sediminis]|uniref:MerR HTH family regulatory protein n=1 Tax=Roseivivax sediminis TaxID=936889 RepID=A0A1I1WYX4_9RHOB|nr:MerR family transcriptional regulator [Roseivivax sediminis]SFD98290.1 MerR HTH family regulatory protein [Roseivivax sediminis]